MANFSKYGGLSEEFQAVFAQQARPNVDPSNVSELKRVTNAGREAASAKVFEQYANQLTVKTFDIPTRDGSTIQARSYVAKNSDDKSLPLYIHLHGGGFCFGTLDSEDAACALIAITTSVVVLNVNYRHTPEFVYPTAWNDAEDAFEWARNHAKDLDANPDTFIIGGISAGSHLAAWLVQEKVRQGFTSIKGQVLMIPSLVNAECYGAQLTKLESPDVFSYVENRDAPILPRAVVDRFNGMLYPTKPDDNDLRANPGNAGSDDVKGLPPTVIGVAGTDVLRDEGLLYAGLLAANGVSTNVHVFKGVPHGFRRYGCQLSLCAVWDTVIQDGIRWVLEPIPLSNEVSVHEGS